MTDKADLLDTLKLAAERIAAQDGVEWGCWVAYLLEALGQHAGEGEYREFLTGVRDDVEARLRSGTW